MSSRGDHGPWLWGDETDPSPLYLALDRKRGGTSVMSERGKALGQQLIDRMGAMRGDRGDVSVLVSREDWLDLYVEFTKQFHITTLTIPGPIGNLLVQAHDAVPPGRYVFLVSRPGQFSVKQWGFKDG